MKDRRLKILWNSNAPWSSSGYSVQTKDLLTRFVKDGWNVACSCFYGLEGGMIYLDGIKCYPKMGQPYGGDACYYHSKDFGADVCITFQDVWPLDMGLINRMQMDGTKWIPYVPIDHDPLQPNIEHPLKSAYRVVTFSRFGKKACEDKGLQSTLILEGTDIDIFKPMDKMKCRKTFGLPKDIFLFGMVSANKDDPPRKCFQQVMDAFARFHKKHPKSGLYFQTLLEQKGGFNITKYAEYLGISEYIYYPPPYHLMYKSPHEVVSQIMNAFDVLLCPSNSEGFGLPIIEAQACGVPVIVNDFCSMPELVVKNKTGLITKTGYKRWVPVFSYSAPPDVDDLYAKMEQIFTMDRVKMGKAGRKHILENYDINKRVSEEWVPFLEKIQLEILGPKKEEVTVNGTNKKISK